MSFENTHSLAAPLSLHRQGVGCVVVEGWGTRGGDGSGGLTKTHNPKQKNDPAKDPCKNNSARLTEIGTKSTGKGVYQRNRYHPTSLRGPFEGTLDS